MGDLLVEREQWAEMEARLFDKTASALEKSADGWLAREPHPDSSHMATVCLLKASAWRDAARSLRQPRAIRLERSNLQD